MVILPCGDLIGEKCVVGLLADEALCGECGNGFSVDEEGAVWVVGDV